MNNTESAKLKWQTPEYVEKQMASRNTPEHKDLIRKLTLLQAKEIRNRFEWGETQVSLAGEFGVSQATVSSIIQKKSYV